MLLPEKLLNQVGYYHHTTVYKEFAMTDQITIYFKPWWRPAKKFKFRRIVHSDIYHATAYERAPEFVELLEQLRCHLYDEC